jgi:hypothetical protein
MSAKSRRTSASPSHYTWGQVLGRWTKDEKRLNSVEERPLSPRSGREEEGATTRAGGRRKPGNNKVGEDMTRKRRENKPVKIRSGCFQRILAREGGAPVALLPEGATRAPVML